MKKSVCVFLLVLLPLMAFSESIFMFHIGTDIQKLNHIEALDNLIKSHILGKLGKDSNTVPYPKSKILIPMFSTGIDMQFVS